MIHEINRAIVFVPNEIAHKMLTRGIVLPEGYEIVVNSFHISPERQSIGFVVESEHLPHTVLGEVLPNLFIEDLGSHLRVEPWEND